MVPTSYTELFIFLIGAVGAALMLGTGAALLRWRRTGAFPGREQADSPTPTGVVRGAVARCALGGVVLVGALGALWAARS